MCSYPLSCDVVDNRIGSEGNKVRLEDPPDTDFSGSPQGDQKKWIELPRLREELVPDDISRYKIASLTKYVTECGSSGAWAILGQASTDFGLRQNLHALKMQWTGFRL